MIIFNLQSKCGDPSPINSILKFIGFMDLKWKILEAFAQVTRSFEEAKGKIIYY